MLAEPWNEERLALFFGDRPVAEWFNPAHPRVKSGEVVPAVFGRLAGFNVTEVHNWTGLVLDSIGPRDPSNCPCVTGVGAQVDRC